MEGLVYKNNFRFVRGLCGEYINGKIYFHSLDFNGILEYDLEKNKKKIIAGRDTVKDDSCVLSAASILYKDSIYFIHRFADSILKFSVLTQDKKEIFAEGKNNAFNPVIIEDKLFLMPQFYIENIPYINLMTDEICYIPFSIPGKIRRLINDEGEPIFCGAIRLNEYIYRICRFGPYINRFNSINNSSRYIRVNGIDEKFYEITYDGRYFWISFIGSSRIIKWEANDNRIVKCIDMQAYMSEPVEVISVRYIRGKLYILIKNSAKILEWDESNESIYIYDPTEIPGFQGSGTQIFSPNICQDEMGGLYFLPRNANGILTINDKRCMKLLKTDVATSDILDICRGMQLNERMCFVDDFFDIIESHKEGHKLYDEKSIGEQIWKCFRQEVQK